MPGSDPAVFLFGLATSADQVFDSVVWGLAGGVMRRASGGVFFRGKMSLDIDGDFRASGQA